MKKYLLTILLFPSLASAVRSPSAAFPVGFQVFPSSNVWNTRIDFAEVSSSNTLWINIINGHAGHNMHADFGTKYLGALNGIPYNLVSSLTPLIHPAFSPGGYENESDSIPVAGLPIPSDALAEGDPYPGDPYVDNSDSDKHLILVDTTTLEIWEMNQATRTAGGSNWMFNQLSYYNLQSNALRTNDWTSADAGGLNITRGLIRPDEIQAGVIPHAIRFTLSLTHSPHIWPARHDANSGGILNPPFGMRVRMKSSYTPSPTLCGSTTNQIIIMAMKNYGMIMADNGGDWFFSGAPSELWDQNDLNGCFNNLFPINAFEVIDESTWIVDPNSGAAVSPVITPTTLPGSVSIH